MAQDEIHAALLQAASKVFLRDGYRATRMQDIAAEAGLSTGAIYNRFRGKAEIFAALLEARPQTSIDRALDEAEQANTLPKTLRELNQIVADGWPRKSDAMMVEALIGARGDTEAKHLGLDRLRSTAALHRKVLLRSQAAGLLASDLELEAVADLIALVRMGSAVLELVGDNGGIDVESVYDLLLKKTSSLRIVNSEAG